MYSPDMNSAIELAKDTARYMGLLSKRAQEIPVTFPSGNDDCCVRYATSLADEFDSDECSQKILDRVLALAIATCR
jgi:hypothetical protein